MTESVDIRVSIACTPEFATLLGAIVDALRGHTARVDAPLSAHVAEPVATAPADPDELPKWSKERTAIVVRGYPAGDHIDVLHDAVNALPGPPVSKQDIYNLTTKRKLLRPVVSRRRTTDCPPAEPEPTVDSQAVSSLETLPTIAPTLPEASFRTEEPHQRRAPLTCAALMCDSRAVDGQYCAHHANRVVDGRPTFAVIR